MQTKKPQASISMIAMVGCSMTLARGIICTLRSSPRIDAGSVGSKMLQSANTNISGIQEWMHMITVVWVKAPKLPASKLM